MASGGWRRGAPGARHGGLSKLLLLGCLSLLAMVSSVRAEPVVPEARIESARGLALGTGSRASSVTTHAQADNPANVATGAQAQVESIFGYQPQLESYATGASVADSMTGRIAAGLSTRFLFGDNAAGEHSGWEGRLTLAMAIGSMISVGVAGRYSNITVSNPHVRPEHVAVDDEPADRTFKLKAFTMDTAVTVRPFEGLSLSALGYNLINTDTPLAPLKVGGSVAFGANGFSLGGDLLADLNLHGAFSGTKLQMGGGLEYLMQGIPLRVGYAYDQGRRTNAVTGGFGYLDQRFGIQLSLRQVVNGEHKDTTLFGSLQYFVQ